MNKTEILKIVKKVYFGPQENSVISPLLSQLRALLPNSNISDLIFQDMRNLGPEQVVDEAIFRQAEHDKNQK